MPAPIVVEWQVGKGLAAVHEAFKSVAKAQAEMERSVARAAGREDTVRRRGTATFEQLQERKFRALVRTTERETKETERAEQRKLKAVERAKREEQRIVDRANRIMVRSVERAAADEVRAREQAASRALAIQLRTSQAVGREAARQAREESALRGRFTGRVAATVAGSVRSAVGTMARVGGGALALGGGFSVADAVQTGITNRGKAADLATQSNGAVSPQAILEKSAAIGNIMGVATEQVIGGLDAFVAKSGDVKAGFASIQDLVELATATGADLQELSRTAGIVQMTTGNAKDTMGVMREMAGMGRAGSVDMRELSQYAGRITSGASQFGNKREAITQLGAFVQQAAATGGATSAPEATEAVARFATDVFEHEGAFKGAGVKTRDKSGKFLRAPIDIVKDSIGATGGDTGKLLEMFGKMSYRSVAGYQDVYNRASQGVLAGGGTAANAKAAGMKAIDAAFATFAATALKEAQVKEEATRRIQETDKQLEMVLNQLRESVAAELLPELRRLMPQIRELVPAFVKLLRATVDFAEWFSKNPLSGIGVVIAASVAKDIAAAGIGAALKQMIALALAGGAPVAPGAAAAGSGLASSLGSAGAGAALGAGAVGGALGAGAAYGTVNLQTGMQVGAQRSMVSASVAAGNDIASLMRAPASPETVARMRGLQSKLEGQLGKARDARDSVGPSFLTAAAGQLTGQGPAMAAAQADEKRAADTSVMSIKESLEKLGTAIQRAELKISAASSATQTPNPNAATQNVSMASSLRGGTQ